MKLNYDKYKLAEEGEYNDRNLVRCRCGKHWYPSKKMFIEFLKQFKDVKATADIWTHSDIPSGKVTIHCEISYVVKDGERGRVHVHPTTEKP